MTRWIMALAIVLGALGLMADRAVAGPKIALDRLTQDYLEGKWSITTDKSSPKTACAIGGSEEEYTIEFRNSGGTVLIVDDVDADFRMPIAQASGDRNAVRLVLKNGDGTLFKDIKLIRVSGDELKLQENIGNVPDSRIDGFAYRCAKTRHEVVAALPPHVIVALSLRSPRGTILVETLGVESDKQTCDQMVGRRELELELIGPVYYSINEYTGQSYGRTWLINGAEMQKDGTIIFTTDKNSPTRTFTLKREGKHFRVPEIGAEFVRCSESNPAIPAAD